MVKDSLPNNQYALQAFSGRAELVSHVHRLRRFHRSFLTEEEISELAKFDDDDELYVVESVVSHSTDEDGNIVFRLRWSGYEPEEDTYQCYDEDVRGNEQVESYIDAHKLRGKLFGEDGGVVIS
ncbi:Chromo (CHRromatin Organization MOdifier) domain [Carpediemonas membranifera]|uniref:Chromo (CHRromatin Organization MOdifier) domain n=1 Tax=Carpediemonas membranifera TaxID=201153 RepID=A0A8J6B4U0_9EUKA|nr:Chromo (CHRromatin Organization MOdifier) domain [Carpediemonas membranifera]|eukprot:KAG9395703.1 Chromo (CHRromatin Organization MOdifier) domain [Carpediemonas membranifera]